MLLLLCLQECFVFCEQLVGRSQKPSAVCSTLLAGSGSLGSYWQFNSLIIFVCHASKTDSVFLGDHSLTSHTSFLPAVVLEAHMSYYFVFLEMEQVSLKHFVRSNVETDDAPSSYIRYRTLYDN